MPSGVADAIAASIPRELWGSDGLRELRPKRPQCINNLNVNCKFGPVRFLGRQGIGGPELATNV
eukprot:15469896-Alexandrium_andersonii.AAC.1